MTAERGCRLSASHWLAAIQRQVHSHCWHRPGLSLFNRLLVASVLLVLLVQILETEPGLRQRYAPWFLGADLAVGVWFGLDVLLRFISAGALPQYRGWRGRLRWFVSWTTWTDLLALLPFLIYPWVEGLGANDLAFLRLFQGLKIVRVAHVGHLGPALAALHQALQARRWELFISFMLACSMMLLAAVLLYLVEGNVQPAAFGSIPRALWWAMETLTTVGYGDVAPITPLGRLLSGLVALAGIGVIALPTGILAAAFSEAFHRREPARTTASDVGSPPDSR